MAQQAITLKIAGKSYSLNIESEKEEVYRLAEREVNNYLAAIKQNNFKNWTTTCRWPHLNSPLQTSTCGKAANWATKT